MKRLIIFIIIFSTLISGFAIQSKAIKYEFEMGEDIDNVDDELSALLESLPDNIRDKLNPIDESQGKNVSQKYSFKFFLNFIKEECTKILPHGINLLSKLLAIIILIALFKNFQKSFEIQSISPAIEMCFSLVTVLSIGAIQKNVIILSERFLTILSETMLLIVPIIEGIYISLGNYTQATVSVTAINLMISFTENLFANAIYPAIVVSFLMATLSCITQNKAIICISKILRTFITTSIILIATLMTFALTLQLSTAAAADNFTNRTVRFALGSYIPIVGGAVSETYSLIKGSLSLIKSLSGTTAIVIIVLLCLGPMLTLLISKFAINIASNLSGALNCDREECLLKEIGNSYTLLISVILSSSLMYIIALAQFCKASVLVN